MQIRGSRTGFQKQFSGKMTSWNHDSNDITERVVAVAAAAYVINTIAKSSIRDQEKKSADLAPSLIKNKSRKEDTTRFSGNYAKHEKWNPYLHVTKYYEFLLASAAA